LKDIKSIKKSLEEELGKSGRDLEWLESTLIKNKNQ
jgi:hypothetical protein